MSALHLTLIIPAGLTHLTLELLEAPAETVLQDDSPARVVEAEPTPEPAPEPEPAKKRYIGV